MRDKKSLKGIRKKAKSIWNKIPKTVRISIFVFVFALPTWLILAVFIRKFLNTFGEGLLIETFGMLLDVLVIGIIILWLNEIRDKKRRKELEIQRYQEEIDDYRGWDEKEATFRIVGNIRRLNKRGVTEINLWRCYLVDARLKKAKLQGADLWEVNLQEANLKLANLQGADLAEANLEGGNLQGTNLQEANLADARFKGATFKEASLQGAKNLDAKQLSIAKTLYQAMLDPELEKEIREKYPYLLEKPEEEE